MHVQTVKLHSVFGIQRHLVYRGGKHTTFGFASENFSRRSAVVQGWPEIASGLELSFVLARKDDWDNILGWFNHTDAQKVTPDITGSIVASLVFFAFFVFIIWLLVSHGLQPFLIFLATATACGCAYWANSSIKFANATRLINRIAENAANEGK